MLTVIFGVIGIIVAVIPPAWEFGVRPRKRLGYRVQMDTAPTDVGAQYAGAWKKLAKAGETALGATSIALLRIENLGRGRISEGDYGAPAADPVGVEVRFPGRSVAGVVITEISDPALERYFKDDRPGLGMRDDAEDGHTVGVVELPKVGLDGRAHYKALVLLEQAEGYDRNADDPLVVGTVGSGMRHTGKIKKTESRTSLPWWITPAIALLAAGCLIELPFAVSPGGNQPGPSPVAGQANCAAGTLSLVGSTAFKDTLQQAAQQYHQRCPEANVSYDSAYSDSGNGFQYLVQTQGKSGNTSVLEFSDGPQPENSQVTPRPVAIVPFSLVVNSDVTGVQNLTPEQIQDLFTGKAANWNDDGLGGPAGLAVVLVGRTFQSGTQQSFQRELLGGKQEKTANSGDCTHLESGKPPIACEESTTPALLHTVATTNGAIGYSDLQDAQREDGTDTVQINGRDASSAASYPFKQTEYAYTYGAPASGSLEADFLDYLTSRPGQSIIKSNDDSPCADPANADCESP